MTFAIGFVSLLIDQAARLKYIQKQAGHSSTLVTMDTIGSCSRVKTVSGSAI